jgi:hypothetical protein
MTDTVIPDRYAPRSERGHVSLFFFEISIAVQRPVRLPSFVVCIPPDNREPRLWLPDQNYTLSVGVLRY